MILTAKELAEIRRHAVEDYPREACGVVLTRAGLRRLLRCRNIQDQLHAKDPVRHPRDARTGYFIDPQDLLLIGQLESQGFAVAVIYHSHADAQGRGGGTGAYFSPTDRQQALLGGEPMYPKAVYAVVSVVAGQVERVAGFRWDPEAGDFTEIDLGRLAPHEWAAVLAGRAWAWLGQWAPSERRVQ